MVNVWFAIVKLRLTKGKAPLAIVNAWLTMDNLRLRMGKL